MATQSKYQSWKEGDEERDNIQGTSRPLAFLSTKASQTRHGQTLSDDSNTTSEDNSTDSFTAFENLEACYARLLSPVSKRSLLCLMVCGIVLCVVLSSIVLITQLSNRERKESKPVVSLTKGNNPEISLVSPSPAPSRFHPFPTYLAEPTAPSLSQASPLPQSPSNSNDVPLLESHLDEKASSGESDVSSSNSPTYRPGNLTVSFDGLLLSEGLQARRIATSGEPVLLGNGDMSAEPFHSRPDGGAAFPWFDGGMVYVSNSEVLQGRGGVGALYFDQNGALVDYKMLLTGTNFNCGGGRTPWNTWVSCEEVEFDGQIYQVDPTGQRGSQLMTLGKEGGRWESFAFDVRDKEAPHYFATEDHNKGTVRRFVPDDVDWEDPWDQLHGKGKTDFLMIFPNATNDGGTFQWTDDIEDGRNNAREYYPETEGIDVYEGQMYFVCKKIAQMFVLNLDEGTYYSQSTQKGLFDGRPDQLARLLDDEQELLYFTEESGRDNGVHARDRLGRFYTVFESPEYGDETTGLSFSPDGKWMFAAYQDTGYLYMVWRTDGLPFHARHLDVKFHHSD